MKNKQIILIWTVVSVFTASFDAVAKVKETLQIYLPREITLEDSTPNLGQVAIIRGSEPMASKAAEVALGQISSLDHGLVINKTLILSRLACSGIPASKVTLTGAEETLIHLRHQRIKGDQMVQEAAAFLKANLPDNSICQMDAVRIPDDLILPGDPHDVTLSCRILNNSTKNQCKVQVAALQGDKEIGTQDIVFRFRYKCRKAITTTAIPKGTLISDKNATIKDDMSNYPEPAGWTAPYGLIASRDLSANAVITENSVGVPKPEVLLKRNQSVLIKIDRPGLTATANGKTLQDGKIGDCIKVQNVNSQVIVMAKVNEDGTVEPVF